MTWLDLAHAQERLRASSRSSIRHRMEVGADGKVTILEVGRGDGPRLATREKQSERMMTAMIWTLYFGNLPWAVTNADLEKAVSEHAEVISARVVTDRETGRSRGFGFVKVPTDAAQTVIDALNGADWEGRRLVVNEAKPREERPGGFGGGRDARDPR